MERLTERFDGWVMRKVCHGPCRTCNRVECADIYTMIDRLAAYEDTGLEPEDIVNALKTLDLFAEAVKGVPLNRIRELSQAEKDGRLVVLPFCIGAPLYETTGKGVWEYQVEQFSIGSKDLFIHAVDKCIWYRGGRIFGPEQIGKTVFLTREEAEAALKKRGGEPMRPIDVDFAKERIKKSGLTNQEKIAFLLLLEDVPMLAPPPNDPLTLEELREMDGEPVWIHSFSAVQRKTKIACWAIVETIGHANATFLRAGVNCRTTKWFANYGQTWLAYHRKPEEGA